MQNVCGLGKEQDPQRGLRYPTQEQDAVLRRLHNAYVPLCPPGKDRDSVWNNTELSK